MKISPHVIILVIVILFLFFISRENYTDADIITFKRDVTDILNKKSNTGLSVDSETNAIVTLYTALYKKKIVESEKSKIQKAWSEKKTQWGKYYGQNSQVYKDLIDYLKNNKLINTWGIK